MNNAEQKEALIKEFIEMSKGKSNDEILPLILAISSKAKKLGISFSKEESLEMIDTLAKSVPEEKRQQMNKIVQILTQF